MWEKRNELKVWIRRFFNGSRVMGVILAVMLVCLALSFVRESKTVRIYTTSKIPFDIITFEDDKVSVSSIMRATSGYAPVESAVVETILSACKSDTKTPPPLVLDVGANLGYFSLLAAAHGCRVRAYEPSTAMAERMQKSVALNGFEDLITVVNAGVGSVKGSLRFAANPNPALSRVVVDDPSFAHLPRLPIVALADEIKENVLLIKMDTEGFEPYALLGLLPACSKFVIENIVIEIKKPSQDATLERVWACLDEGAKLAAIAAPARGMWFREWYANDEIASFYASGLTAATPHGYVKRLQTPWDYGVEDAWFSLKSESWGGVERKKKEKR